MRPETLKSTIKSLFHGRQTPILITGAPGGGKTSVVRQCAAEEGVGYIERHLPTSLVEDFGIPDMMNVSDNTFKYVLPDWFPAKGSKFDDGRGGFLCFDDRNQGAADLQKVLANIQEARNLHGIPLAEKWMIVSTGNREKDRAGSNRVLSHLADREMELEFETHLDDWTKWAIDNDIKTEVIQFIRFRTNLLHDFDPQRPKNATPRGWEAVSNIMGDVPPEAEYECFKGRVGEGAAAEFTGFLKIYRKLPNPDRILMNPDTAEVPDDPATLYALSGSLAERASESNFDRVTTYTDRMPPEFSVLCVSYAVRKKAELAETQAFTKWILNHEEVLF
jgi:hypothetical protein